MRFAHVGSVMLCLVSMAVPASAQLTDDDIAIMRKEIQREGWTFSVGKNDATKYPLNQLTGVIKPKNWRVGARFDACPPQRDLPATFDWRSYNGRNYCTPIKQQDGCGCCWAFALIGSVESNILLRFGLTADLSEQWLVSCTGLGGCAVEWPGNAANFLLRNGQHRDPCGGYGAVLESEFPYVAWAAPCGCPYSHPYRLADWAFIGDEWGIPTIAQLKQAMLDHGPICVCVYADAYFQGYNGGIFNHCSGTEINHTVDLVGWDDSQGVWFLRNSWGDGWGEGGYMRIAYNCSLVGYNALYVENAGLQLSCDSIPSGANAYQPGQMPVLTATIRDANGNFVDPQWIDVFPSPDASGYPIIMYRVSTGHWQSSANTAWRFGCDCYTFTLLAGAPGVPTAQCSMTFTPCPCVPSTPVAISSLGVSPDQLCPGAQSATISHSINVTAFERVTVSDPNGAVVRTLASAQSRPPGIQFDTWDGRNSSGQAVAPGTYWATVEAIHLDTAWAFEYFGAMGSQNTQVYNPWNAILGPDGNAYVLDLRWDLGGPCYHVLKYGSTSPITLQNQYFCPNSVNPGGLDCSGSQGMAADSQGRLYILNDLANGTGGRRITVWNSATGSWIAEFGGDVMQWSSAYYVVVPLYYHAPNNRLYTWAYDATGGGCKVFVFDAASHTLVAKLDVLADTSNVPSATGIAVDADNNVWVAVRNYGVYVVSHSGQVVRSWPSVPWEWCRLVVRNGRTVYLCVETGQVYVWDLYGNELASVCVSTQEPLNGGLNMSGAAGQYFVGSSLYQCQQNPSGLWAASKVRDLSSSARQSVPVMVGDAMTDPTGASASPNPACAGQSVTLTASGGSGGTYKWYAGNCGGTYVGSGSPLTISAPGATTTYHVRMEGLCGNSACASTTLSVGTVPTTPSSASASPNVACAGQPVTLTASGGAGGTYKWYSGSCGGTYVGSGSSLPINAPATDTTYYVRVEGCGNSTCAATTLAITAPPVAPTGASVDPNTACAGQAVTLTASGGSGGTYEWYSGGCGGTYVGSGSLLTISAPTATTTYYVRTKGCGNSTCASTTLSIVDFADFEPFLTCMHGPGLAAADGCPCADFDLDGDVDLADFAQLQALFGEYDNYTWHPLGTGLDSSTAYALTVYNGELIAGGGFSNAGGSSANGIARWNGSAWQALGTGTDNIVISLTVYNGELIAGGNFGTAGDVVCSRIARWDGTQWRPLGSGVSGDVNALAAYNGELIAGGIFTTAGGITVGYIARWNGSAWQTLGTGTNAVVTSLAVYNGELIAGGSFTTAGGVACGRIARWNGTQWQPLGSGMNTDVNVLGVYNSELIAGGSFTMAGGVTVSRVARWNGTNWQPLGTGVDGVPICLVVYNSELIAGGAFSNAGSAAANHVARWNGTSWQSLGTGMSDLVNSLTVYNSELIAGGWFTNAGGVSCDRIARWGAQ